MGADNGEKFVDYHILWFCFSLFLSGVALTLSERYHDQRVWAQEFQTAVGLCGGYEQVLYVSADKLAVIVECFDGTAYKMPK